MSSVVVNCRFLSQPVTGVQRFAEQITLNIVDLLPDVALVAPRGDLRLNSIGGVRVEQIGRASGHAWEQIDLPRWLRRNGQPFLVNLANTAPIRYAPKLSTVHDVTYVRYPQSYSRPFRAWYRFATPTILRTSAEIVTVSRFSQSEISSVYGVSAHRVSVVPNAVSSAFLNVAASETWESDNLDLLEFPYFLSVATRSAHKGVSELVEQFQDWRTQCGSQSRLVLVGGSSRNFASIGEPGHEPSDVILLGRVTDEDLAQLYLHAHALAFPSRYEGFGIPPLEAASVGCPVIAADIPAVREVLQGAFSPFNPDQPGALAERLTRISQDAEYREKLIRDGQERSHAFSWHRSAQQIADLIDTHLGRADSRRASLG